MTVDVDRPFPLDFTTRRRPTSVVEPKGLEGDTVSPIVTTLDGSNRPAVALPSIRVETIFWVFVFSALCVGLFGCFYTF